MKFEVEYTDTFAGEANYSWVRRATVEMPDLDHYEHGGTVSYGKASQIQRRELMKRAKAAVGLTGVRGIVHHYGEVIEFRPYRSCTIMFIIARY